MKWLYWHHCTEDKSQNPILDFKTWYEKSKGTNLQRTAWIGALKADFGSSWEVVREHINEYDGVMLEFLSNLVGKDRIKHVPEGLIKVGTWDVWTPNPQELMQNQNDIRNGPKVSLVDWADLIIMHEGQWEGDVYNRVFKTNKFIPLIAPLDIEGIKPYRTSLEKKIELKKVVSSAPVNYHVTIRNTARVLNIVAKKHDDFKGYMTHIRRRGGYEPFIKLPTLPYPDFLKLMGESYLGMFNSVGGGLASIAGFGAVLNTPFVGSDLADYLVECFPDLYTKHIPCHHHGWDWKRIGINLPLVNNAETQAKLLFIQDRYRNAVYREQAALCNRLIEDLDFWKEVTQKAERITNERFSFEGSEKRFYDLLKERELIA